MTANEPLFAPLQLGAFRLSHRVVMPPTAQRREVLPNSAPDAPMVDYYKKRATPSGLMITEAAFVCHEGHPDRTRPGIYSADQVNRWREVTDAVHQEGGIVLAQLGYAWEDYARAPDMDKILEDYRSAAENASDAGFDGIELDVSTGSLPAYLLRQHPSVGSAVAISPLRHVTPLIGIVQTLCAVWEPLRIGIGLSVSASQQVPSDLERLGLAYLRLAGHRTGLPAPTSGGAALPILLSGQFDAAAAAAAVAAKEAAAIGFEEDFAIHPDLPARIRSGVPVGSAADANPRTGNQHSYTDASVREPASGRPP